jgi:hypothetical protein
MGEKPVIIQIRIIGSLSISIPEMSYGGSGKILGPVWGRAGFSLQAEVLAYDQLF